MRLKITLHPKTGELLLPSPYQRPLAAAWWKALGLPDEKEINSPKLVCFSPLLFKQRQRQGPALRLTGRAGYFYLATPLPSILSAVERLPKTIDIAGNLLDIGKVELASPPEFTEEMTWRSFPGSGICTRQITIEGGLKKGRFIFPEDQKSDCENVLARTLLTKWAFLAEREPSRAVRWCGDANPLTWAANNMPKVEILSFFAPKREKIKEGATHHYWPGTVKLTGNPAWQRLVWDCGLGTRTGLGLGMVELVEPQLVVGVPS